MNGEMEIRRATWSAAVRLALLVSALAAAVTVALSAAGDVPRGALVLAVVLVGFAASWIQTGRIVRAYRPSHRVLVVPVRRRVAS
jgi:hypothetical protein